MNLEINMKQLQDDALHAFNNGYACSESVIFALNKHFDLGMADDAIAMSSGFPWGLGGAGELCGAVAGGTMVLGYLYGRRQPGDPKIERCFKLTNALADAFKDEFHSCQCGTLIEGYEKHSPERKCKCNDYVSAVVTKTAKIILREENADA